MAATNGDSAVKLDAETFGNVINNELTKTTKTRHGINPWTSEPLPEVPVSTQEDVDKAVLAARKAFGPWAKQSWDERAQKVCQLADAIEANYDFFRQWLVKETGKPLQTATLEMAKTLELLRGFTKLRIEDEILEDTETHRAKLRYVPLGVGAGIVPWNWPLALGIGNVGLALMTGNCLIMKPSPFTPYVGLKLGELGARIFPPGVFQVLSGADDLGVMLTEHPNIDKIAFTGSIATGKRVMASCSSTLKRLTLELGGNDAAIVCEDVDIEKAVPKIATLALMSSGQICMSIKRIYVHEKIYDKFRDAFTHHIKTEFVTGTASDEKTFIGPVQNKMQYDQVKGMFSDIEKEGWAAALGGQLPEESKGYFLEPTVIDSPPEDSRIVREEPFGPIVPLLKWNDEDDAVRRANDSKMGLGASVWTSDLARGEKIAERLEAGSVWVNTHFHLSPNVPAGGHKWSGMGMMYGVVGMKAWCNPQSIWLWKQ